MASKMAIVETESDIDTEKIMRHKGLKEDLKREKLHIQQKFTKRGKKRPQDLVIPDEINAFKAEQWIENLRQPAELAGLVPYTDPVQIDSPHLVRTETGKTVYYGMYIYLKKRTEQEMSHPCLRDVPRPGILVECLIVQLLQDRVTQGKEQLKRSHASYCQGMESDQTQMKLLIKEIKKTSASVRRRIRDNIRTEMMSKEMRDKLDPGSDTPSGHLDLKR
uniref:Uncharacterized protein n=1 Tax=Timema monikensis TaxID=170555 RepID=A0A7R9EHS7_9NEOP|nr:unnamed protein product [Timema monikensis]